MDWITSGLAVHGRDFGPPRFLQPLDVLGVLAFHPVLRHARAHSFASAPTRTACADCRHSLLTTSCQKRVAMKLALNFISRVEIKKFNRETGCENLVEALCCGRVPENSLDRRRRALGRAGLLAGNRDALSGLGAVGREALAGRRRKLGGAVARLAAGAGRRASRFFGGVDRAGLRAPARQGGRFPGEDRPPDPPAGRGGDGCGSTGSGA